MGERCEGALRIMFQIGRKLVGPTVFDAVPQGKLKGDLIVGRELDPLRFRLQGNRSAVSAQSQPVGSDGMRNFLDQLLAQIFEDEAGAMPQMVANTAGDADPAALRQRLIESLPF